MGTMATLVAGFTPKNYHKKAWLLAAMDNYFGLFRSYQHGIPSKQVQVPKKNTLSNGKGALHVGCGYKDEFKYRKHKRATC